MVIINTTGMDETVILTGEETRFMYDQFRIREAETIIHINEVGTITLLKIRDKDCFLEKNKTILGL